jgi:DNA polymerase-3 subunit alpha/error-prone DNA polymerase
MEMFCAARVVKDALWLRYKSKQFFCMLCSKGHPLALSQEIYRQIESFAGTPFARHSASYAVESYQSLYLKCITP